MARNPQNFKGFTADSGEGEVSRNICVEPAGPIWAAAKAERNWLVYRLVPNPDPAKKPIKHPSSSMGNCPIPADQAAAYLYDEAVAIRQMLNQMLNGRDEGPYGIGYMPREGSAMVCVDLDKVADFDGFIVPEAEPLLVEVLTGETFVEASPSKRGLHTRPIFFPDLLEGRAGISPCQFRIFFGISMHAAIEAPRVAPPKVSGGFGNFERFPHPRRRLVFCT